MLIVVYDVNVLLIVLTTQLDGFDKVLKKKCLAYVLLSIVWEKEMLYRHCISLLL